jgi:hypothetical protein
MPAVNETIDTVREVTEGAYKWGFVTDIDPATVPVTGDISGEEINFTLNFRGAVAALEEDQLFKLKLDVVGDGTILLDTLDIYVLVPGGS